MNKWMAEWTHQGYITKFKQQLHDFELLTIGCDLPYKGFISILPQAPTKSQNSALGGFVGIVLASAYWLRLGISIVTDICMIGVVRQFALLYYFAWKRINPETKIWAKLRVSNCVEVPDAFQETVGLLTTTVWHPMNDMLDWLEHDVGLAWLWFRLACWLISS